MAVFVRPLLEPGVAMPFIAGVLGAITLFVVGCADAPDRLTMRDDGTFTIVQVDYNDARKERDYLTLSVQELVTFIV